MFKTVVWATDGSAAAEAALPHALRLVEESGAALVVAHVRELIGDRGGAYPLLSEDDDVEEQLQAEVEALQAGGVDARLELRSCGDGRVGRSLAGLADEVGADLIVLGTTGHTRVGQLLVGSVTQELLHVSRYPVLAVPLARVAAKT